MKINYENIPVIGFYGYSNSGKTSLIYKIIRRLDKDGYVTAVIKRTDKAISSEPKEKDTSGYRKAGAKITSFSSKSETNFVLPEEMAACQIIEKIKLLSNVDLVIIEGAYDPEIQKIQLGEIPSRDNTIYRYDGNFDCLYKLILEIILRRRKNG